MNLESQSASVIASQVYSLQKRVKVQKVQAAMRNFWQVRVFNT